MKEPTYLELLTGKQSLVKMQKELGIELPKEYINADVKSKIIFVGICLLIYTGILKIGGYLVW